MLPEVFHGANFQFPSLVRYKGYALEPSLVNDESNYLPLRRNGTPNVMEQVQDTFTFERLRICTHRVLSNTMLKVLYSYFLCQNSMQWNLMIGTANLVSKSATVFISPVLSPLALHYSPPRNSKLGSYVQIEEKVKSGFRENWSG